MSKNSDAQKKQILDALQQGAKLTQLDALEQFSCMRLGARIYELKQDGHKIQSKKIITKTGKRVAQYWMQKPKQEVLFI